MVLETYNSITFLIDMDNVITDFETAFHQFWIRENVHAFGGRVEPIAVQDHRCFDICKQYAMQAAPRGITYADITKSMMTCCDNEDLWSSMPGSAMLWTD